MIREFRKYAKEIETACNTALKTRTNPEPLIYEKTVLIKEMVRYIYNGDWTRTASREKYRTWIKNNFDYEMICKLYNTTRASLEVFIHRQNRRLESYIGEAFELIKIDRVQEARVSFYTRTHFLSANNLFGVNLLSMLPNASLERQFQLADCQDEITLLGSLMRDSIANCINKVNKEKLSYLIGLLSYEDKDLLIQKKLLIDKLLSINNSYHIQGGFLYKTS